MRNKEKQNEYMRKYYKTYYKSEQGKLRLKIHNGSEKSKKSRLKYNKTHPEVLKKAMDKYLLTEKGKVMMKRKLAKKEAREFVDRLINTLSREFVEALTKQIQLEC
jgi:hypothetical protein